LSSGTPALLALNQSGVRYTVHEYEHDPRVRAFGEESAAALGVSPEQVYKTLVALVDTEPTLAIVPVSGHLDLKALATACGGRRAEMAPAALAERLTGYVIGGISPIGTKRDLPTYVEEESVLFDVIHVSGGRRGLSLGLSAEDLIAVTGAHLASISRPGPA